jgi:hypothetical protein
MLHYFSLLLGHMAEEKSKNFWQKEPNVIALYRESKL